MANKEFKIQSDTVSLNGVPLSSSVDGKVVLPGVTRATGYQVEEVEDTADQSVAWDTGLTLYVIDYAQLQQLCGAGMDVGFTAAVYTAELDGEGYIDKINVDAGGIYGANDYIKLKQDTLYATQVADPINNFNITDWVSIPFRAKAKATGIESEFGGGGGSSLETLVTPSTSYPVVAVDTDQNRVYVAGDLTNDLDSDLFRIWMDYAPPFIIYIPSDWGYNSGDDQTWIELSGGEDLISEYNGSNLFILRRNNDTQTLVLPSSAGTYGTVTWLDSAGGGASLGDFTINSGDIYNNSGSDARLYTNHTGDAMVQLRAKGTGGDSQWDFHSDGSLTFPDGTVQTTAYTGQSGGGATTSIWIAAGDDPGGSAILSSEDGVTWTAHLDITGMNGSSVYRVAIGAGMIVYLIGDINGNAGAAIYYASNATAAPVMAVGTDSFQSSEGMYWNEVNYLGGYFVAVGSSFTGPTKSPIFAYSSNGIDWTYGNIDPAYFTEVLNSPDAEMYDVAYNGTGYLIPVVDNYNDIGDPTVSGPGAFYITDLTAPVGGAQFIVGSGDPGTLPGNYNSLASYADGTFFVCDDQSTVWTSSDAQTWTSHNMSEDYATVVGYTTGPNDNIVDESTAGTVGGVDYWVATTNDGAVVYTSDNGASFQVSFPNRITDTAAFLDINPAALNFTGTVPVPWEKITIEVANGDDTRWNGTYWASPTNDSNIFQLSDGPEGIGAIVEHGDWNQPTNPVNITFSQGSANGPIAIGDDMCFVWCNPGILMKSSNLVDWTEAYSGNDPVSIHDIYFGDVSSTNFDRLVKGTKTVRLNTDGSILFPEQTFKDAWNGSTTGKTIEFPQTSSHAAIHTQAAQAPNNIPDWLLIQGGRGYGTWSNTEGFPGGSVTVAGGAGGEGQTTGGEGGSVDLQAGAGQGGGDGGSLNIRGGQVIWSSTGTGGAVNIEGGTVNIGLNGTGDGGNVNIKGGLGTVNNGIVTIQTSPGSYEYDNQWTFGNDGALGLAAYGAIKNIDGFTGAVNIASSNYSQLMWTTFDGVAEANPDDTSEQLNWLYVEQGGIFLENNINTLNPVGWRFGTDGKITFPDGSKQATAYVPQLVNMDGGGASVKYDNLYASADGGFSGSRYGSATTFIDGGNVLTEANDNNLDGGGA